MADVKICDICGKVIGQASGSCVSLRPRSVSYGTLYDLCKDCTIELQYWFNDKKEKENVESNR